MASIRITRKMADDAAEIMSKKAYEGKIEEIDQEMKEKVTKLCTKYIPSPVLACAKEYGDYLAVTKNVVVRKMVKNSDGNEIVSGYICSKTDIPIPQSCTYIMMNADDFAVVESLEKKKRQMISDKNTFCFKVSDALVSLRTLSKVETEFPEAVKYIDVPLEKSLPAPILSDIRSIVSQIV